MGECAVQLLLGRCNPASVHQAFSLINDRINRNLASDWARPRITRLVGSQAGRADTRGSSDRPTGRTKYCRRARPVQGSVYQRPSVRPSGRAADALVGRRRSLPDYDGKMVASRVDGATTSIMVTARLMAVDTIRDVAAP